jgi:hypothetical protein
MSAIMSEPLPLEVGQLGNFEARMTRSLRGAMEDWDEVCSALGEWEAIHLIGAPSEAVLEQHRAWVTGLLAWGKLLEGATDYAGFLDRAAALRVKARLRHLQDKLDLWHREMSPDEEVRLLRAAFA